MKIWDKIRSHLEPIYRDKTLKEALFIIIFRSDTKFGKGFDIALIILIISSIINVMFESMQPFGSYHYRLLHGFEYAFTALFTIEYILRVYCAPQPSKYIFSFYGLVDLLAILPVYFGIFIPQGHYLIAIRAFRLLRIFRVFKLFSLLRQGDVLMYSIQKSLPKIIVFFVFVLILVICIGTVMYVVEGSQPNSGFTNIPISIYWAIVTMTTVGYGDITPATSVGRLLSAVVMLVGYTIIAVPTGIVTASLIKRSSSKKGDDIINRKCPSCRRNNDDEVAFYCKYCGTALDPDQEVKIRKKKD